MIVVTLGLHVVVGIQQDSWCTVRRRMTGNDGGCSPFLDGAHVVEPGGRQQVRDGSRTAVHLAPPSGVRPHGLDPNEVLEVAAHRWQDVPDAFHKIGHDPTVVLTSILLAGRTRGLQWMLAFADRNARG
jgi:hypothetical protein